MCVYIYMYIRIHLSLYVYMCIYIYIYMHMYICCIATTLTHSTNHHTIRITCIVLLYIIVAAFQQSS